MEMHGLVDVCDYIDDVIVDLRYAREDNFTGKVVYPFTTCLVLQPVAKALARVQSACKKQGLRLKIWDGYRPVEVQQIFWDLVQDPRYVSPPGPKGGRHCRGTAVDVTLVDRKGKELKMPTLFDKFSERAHRHSPLWNEEEKKNANLLEEMMHKNGFIGLGTEWWHFDFAGWQDYPILSFDVPRYEAFLCP